ncbi:MAG: glycosyltransferase family 2 protein [Lachnospiraceae bacterium]|nr:glycosyltransferase family 2 protein [Lachnospiraceae bacterium]
MDKLYISLKRQTSSDFEWVVINDGSTDNTRKLFKEWTKEERKFQIIYDEVKNGGKHRAINKAVRMASSDAFFVVDSDDYLTDDAVENANYWFSTIKNLEEFAGVSGLRGDKAFSPIGGYGHFENDFIDCTNLQRGEYNLWGNKAEIYKTSLLKQYPFPEFENENFITEAVVWDKIAKDGYKIRWYNRVIYICEYLNDGLSANLADITMNNPKGYLTYLNLLESIYGKNQADLERLEFYQNIIKYRGNDAALKVIKMAAQMRD